MKVFHGSTHIIKDPNIEVKNNRTDFGKGFYTTSNFEQAKRWAHIKRSRIGTEVKTFVNVFEYTGNKELNTLEITGATEQWLDFVFNNRFSESLIHEYDIVIGPVANDNLYQTLIIYENGIIDKEETIKRLKAEKLVDQISFHTLKSLKYLKYIETIEV